MKKKIRVQNNTPECACITCGSTNMIIDEFNPEEWQGIGEAEFAERELGHHGTITCLDCGNTQEFDAV